MHDSRMYRSRNLLKFWIITDNIPETVQDRHIHCVSKNVPPLQLAIIFTYTVQLRQFFGINIAKKVGHQNVLYFPTTPN